MSAEKTKKEKIEEITIKMMEISVALAEIGGGDVTIISFKDGLDNRNDLLLFDGSGFDFETRRDAKSTYFKYVDSSKINGVHIFTYKG